ncbi:replication protein RepA [Rothia aeria]|uniref:replication protein RepA n=1 Tax=Rothia aeria TaxID=172042 RepID=UPI0028E3B295|nr:replication protein RepA [Rothia aeria]
MHNFTVPTNVQSTGNAAGFETLSDLFADPTATTGGTLQHRQNTTSLAINDFTTVAIPWIFVNYQLPLMATKEILWERTDGDITVTLAATPYKDNNGVTQQHLPSGRIAREILIYLTTTALVNKSPVIKISDTWRGLLSDVGIEVSHDNMLAVQKQLRALLKMTIHISHQGTLPDGTNVSTSQSYLVGSSEKLFFNRDGLLDDKHQSVIRLSQEFYERIASAPSPVHGAMLVLRDSWRKIIKENPHQALAGDVFWWLAGRMSRVRREARIPWSSPMAQFGSAATQATKFRSQFRAALAVAAREYFSPLGEDFDYSIYVSEYGFGSRGGNSGILLSPISPEHRKLMAWSRRQGAKTAPAATPVHEQKPTPPQAPSAPEIVPIPAHAGLDLSELRAALAAAGLPTNAVSDGALRAAIDTVLSRATSVGNAQALVTTAIVREPALLTGTAAPVVPAVQGSAASAAPGQGAAPLSSGRPVLPVASCPVHGQDVTGLVCRDCAVELKSADTDSASAEACWRAVRARLTELSRLDGVDTSGEWVRYSSLAAAHGVDA